ncbi:hypothetical protein LCGC14_1100460 [marine sediment metagenome]|uniref:Uncharacterized protein n=1 Tax=marine sediment metagenome TaxID=412755 RepID=A0A0F9QFR3_9ZZZZ
MAIEFTKPAELEHIVYRRFELDVQQKVVSLVFVGTDGNEHYFHTDPKKWVATLKFLFDNLTDVADLKTRIQNYLVTNEIVGGTIVPD